MHEIITLIVDTVSQMGYIGIFLMMLMESTVLPVPSELVMIPAGYLVYKEEMSFFIVILMATFGSVAGALINYFVALKLGRHILIRYGKYFFLKEKSLVMTEKFFETHGAISTFSGRLIPVIRHLISIPAGLAKMNLAVFCLFTALGASIWAGILTLLGYFLGDNQQLAKEYLGYITVFLLLSLSAMIAFYIKTKKTGGQVAK